MKKKNHPAIPSPRDIYHQCFDVYLSKLLLIQGLLANTSMHTCGMVLQKWDHTGEMLFCPCFFRLIKHEGYVVSTTMDRVSPFLSPAFTLPCGVLFGIVLQCIRDQDSTTWLITWWWWMNAFIFLAWWTTLKKSWTRIFSHLSDYLFP